LLNRWARGNLGNLDGRAGALGNASKVRTQAFGNVMTLRGAIVPRYQVDLDVRLIRPVAKEVVPDKTIEVVGSGDTRINLVVGDLRFLRYPPAQLLGNLRGAFKRGPFGR
jgi:hypothetical protein